MKILFDGCNDGGHFRISFLAVKEFKVINLRLVYFIIKAKLFDIILMCIHLQRTKRKKKKSKQFYNN